MAPVKVFGPARSTNVARVLVCLEEVGAEYEVVNINLQAKEHKGPEHLARNVSSLSHSPVVHRSLDLRSMSGRVEATNLLGVLLFLQPFGQIPAFQDGDVVLFGTPLLALLFQFATCHFQQCKSLKYVLLIP